MLKELFKKNKDIIINADIDGILSGAILQKYYGCKIVGFSNSCDRIWLKPEIEDIYKPIYIDLYVNKPEVVCIDQHVVAYDEEHHNQIKGYGTKINPNLEQNRYFYGTGDCGYTHKYPFGTVHYLMSLMAREGIQLELPNLNLRYEKNSWTIGSLFLRADDALCTTFKYRKNALKWWAWLEDSNSSAIHLLKNYIDSIDKYKAIAYKTQLGKFFLALGCDSYDGSYYDITNKEGEVLEDFLNYIDVISKVIDVALDIPRKYSIYAADAYVMSCESPDDMDILKSDNLFSYAFVKSPHNEHNFSYTEEMSKISK
jgi:hypothetical protein